MDHDLSDKEIRRRGQIASEFAKELREENAKEDLTWQPMPWDMLGAGGFWRWLGRGVAMPFRFLLRAFSG